MKTGQHIYSYFKMFIITFIGLSLICNTLCAEKCFGQKSEDKIGLSLQRLQKNLESGKIFLDTPLPISHITGVILTDKNSPDIIILGIDEGDDFKHIVPDDIAMAMQSIFCSHQDAGVSIDPVFEGDRMAEFQDVVFFGPIEGTRVGYYIFYCDYWMKQLAAGHIESPIQGFERYCDCLNNSITKGQLIDQKQNRFWFYPRPSLFVVSPDRNTMLLANSGMILDTEAMGSSAQSLFGKKKSKCAESFINQFNTRVDDLAQEVPALQEMKNFFALCETFTWASNKIELSDWAYFINGDSRIPLHTAPVAETIKVSFYLPGGQGHSLSGGVTCQIKFPSKPFIDSSSQIIILKELVISAKMLSDKIWWGFKFNLTRLLKQYESKNN